MLKEFKEFALKGNVLDLAIGVIIGGAFGKIVSSLVSDILMPPIGLLLGKVNFSDLFIVLQGGKYKTLADAAANGAVTINYGLFINTVIDFLIISFVIFLVVKQVNRLRRQPAPVPEVPTTKECPHCYSIISIRATRCPHCTSEIK